MLKHKFFIRYLDLDNRVRVSFLIEKGRIKQFIIQYETFLEAQWYPVIRYDTVHGFAHADLFHPDGTAEKVSMQAADYNEAFTMAEEDINRHWERYLEDYLKEKSK